MTSIGLVWETDEDDPEDDEDIHDRRKRMKKKVVLFAMLASVLVADRCGGAGQGPGAGKRCKVRPQGHVGLCEQPENDRTHI